MAGEFYDMCSYIHVPQAQLTNEQRIGLERCAALAKDLFYRQGYVYVSEEDDVKTVRLRQACPRYWTSPLAGPYVLLVQYWDKHDLSWFDRHLKSAETAILDAYRNMWPRCIAEREALGVPK